jgi:hypothetical protein
VDDDDRTLRVMDALLADRASASVQRSAALAPGEPSTPTTTAAGFVDFPF